MNDFFFFKSQNCFFFICKGAKKGPVAAAGKGKPAEPAKPKEKVWTKNDDAALKIQTKYRQYRAKKALEKKKKEKQEYEDLMDKLEKEVDFVKVSVISLQI